MELFAVLVEVGIRHVCRLLEGERRYLVHDLPLNILRQFFEQLLFHDVVESGLACPILHDGCELRWGPSLSGRAIDDGGGFLAPRSSVSRSEVG